MTYAAALVAILGLLQGIVVAGAIGVSNYLAPRLVAQGTLVDVLVRLGVFALIALGTSELVGQWFGTHVRQYAQPYWGAFAVGFLACLWLVARPKK